MLPSRKVIASGFVRKFSDPAWLRVLCVMSLYYIYHRKVIPIYFPSISGIDYCICCILYNLRTCCRTAASQVLASTDAAAAGAYYETVR